MNRLVERFLFEVADCSLPPRFNIAPTQAVAAVRLRTPETPAAPHDRRQLCVLRWGLIPSWAKDPSIGSKLINARGETVDTKPSFRSALKHRRCLILSDGYFEWQQGAAQGKKQPYYIQLRDGAPFAFAGLWETWQQGDGSTLESCTIITTEANELTQPYHPRMPVILAPPDYAAWLDCDPARAAEVKGLLRPFPAELMTLFPVSTLVNNPRHDTPECIVPLTG